MPKKADVQSMVERVTNELGPVDILVNSAAILGRGLLYEMEEDDWDRVLDINLKGSYLCAQAIARGIKGALSPPEQYHLPGAYSP